MGTGAAGCPGGFHDGGGFHHGFHGGHGGGFGWGLGAVGLGFFAGAALADPWYYGDYAYGPPAYGYPDYDYAPAPSAAPPPQACGQWIWSPDAQKYDWAPGPCAATPQN